jgi:hypothetical protein
MHGGSPSCLPVVAHYKLLQRSCRAQTGLTVQRIVVASATVHWLEFRRWKSAAIAGRRPPPFPDGPNLTRAPGSAWNGAWPLNTKHHEESNILLTSAALKPAT